MGGAGSVNAKNGKHVPEHTPRESTSSSHGSVRIKRQGFRSTRNRSRSDSTERGERLPERKPLVSKRRRQRHRHGSSTSDSSRHLQRSQRRRSRSDSVACRQLQRSKRRRSRSDSVACRQLQ